MASLTFDQSVVDNAGWQEILYTYTDTDVNMI